MRINNINLITPVNMGMKRKRDWENYHNYLGVDINRIAYNSKQDISPVEGVSKIYPIDARYPKHSLENYRGCLIGGAIGDALGAPVEFMKLDEIKRKYGKDGIQDMHPINGKSRITDDTQMTMFTADGLIKAALYKDKDDAFPNMKYVHNSYMDWLYTQYSETPCIDHGWLTNLQDLYNPRSPGSTCIGALKSYNMGSIDKPINNSKGCGGVMRAAPCGLMYFEDSKVAFVVGAKTAAITHGNPNAYLPAGVLAAIISSIVQGKSIEDSVDKSMRILEQFPGSSDLYKLLEVAKRFAKSDIKPESAIACLGEGWHGDEALAISVYCALKEPNDFKKAVTMAVNHSGDSDSTGAITGNIVGCYLGESEIPYSMRDGLELSDELRTLAKDLYSKPEDVQNSAKRYPRNKFSL